MGFAATILEPPRPLVRASGRCRGADAFSSLPPRRGRGERRPPRGRPERPSRHAPNRPLGDSPPPRRRSEAVIKALVIAIGALLLLVGPMASSVAAPGAHFGLGSHAAVPRSFAAMEMLPGRPDISGLQNQASNRDIPAEAGAVTPAGNAQSEP